MRFPTHLADVRCRVSTALQLHRELDVLLRSTQQRLMNYQYRGLDCHIPDPHLAENVFWRINNLQLFLQNSSDCDVAGLIIERSQQIESLAIECSSETLDDGHERKATGLAVVNRLFGYSNAARRCPKLKCLRVEGLCLESSGVVLPTLLDIERLEHLQLAKCFHSNRLCEVLAQMRLRLKSFSDEVSCNDPVEGSTGVFLTSVGPLEKLRITSHPDTREFQAFSWNALMPHATKLRLLELNDWMPFSNPLDGENRTIAEFKSFCELAPQLQQLAIEGTCTDPFTWAKPHGLEGMLVRMCNGLLFRSAFLTFDYRTA